MAINANVVRGCSTKISLHEIYYTKVSLYGNFQIYGTILGMIIISPLFYYKHGWIYCLCKYLISPCRLQFNGQEHLFNLDDHNLFYYDFLFNYLHLMLEGWNPLAYLSASKRSHTSQSLTDGGGVGTL